MGEDAVRFRDRVTRHRTPILALCRHLVAAGVEASASLTVYREGKPAVLSNGVTVNVPEFVETGERVRVNPRERAYIERVK